jgi:predicted MFS family arabinose efflux permease
MRQMNQQWIDARNHYLAMAALGLFLCGLVALFDPGIASAVALPVAFFAAQSAGTKFARQSRRSMQKNEALRLSGIAAALQVAVGIGGIFLGIVTASGEVIAVHYGTILAVLTAAAVLTVAVTLVGLRFGAAVALRVQRDAPTE